MGKLTWGWALYFLGALLSIWDLVTRWPVPRVSAIALLILAIGRSRD